MVPLHPFSVLGVILGLHVSSVLSKLCNDLFILNYNCYSGTDCCYGNCCQIGYYCCGTSGACCRYELTTPAVIGIIVGALVIGIAVISGLIWLCCVCCRSPRRGHVMNSPPQYIQQPYIPPQYVQQPYSPQYVQQPYTGNSQYDQMVQQQYPTPPRHQEQPVAYTSATDHEQRRHPERPRRNPSVPRAQY